jgi:hypothetical protein
MVKKAFIIKIADRYMTEHMLSRTGNTQAQIKQDVNKEETPSSNGVV